METTVDNQFAAVSNEPSRPQFLSVLCILTWIACGLMFIMTLWGVLFQPSLEQQYDQIEKIRDHSPEAAEKMEEVLQKQQGSSQLLSTAITLIALGFSAFGAWQMWQLKRMGFFIYIAGETLPYLGFVFGGADALSAASAMGGAGQAMVGVAVAVMVVLDLVFVLMYGANLKYMRK
jgi:hypothetical protein